MLSASVGAVEYTEERAPCIDRNPLRNAYFGDLHVHTVRSFDAYQNGTRTTPQDSYDFARGKPIGIPPYDADGKPFKEVQLDRPLDFLAVTDHAEYFGEVSLCTSPDSPVYNEPSCVGLRKTGVQLRPEFASMILARAPARINAVCGEDGERCKEVAKSVWKDMQEIAEAAYDRSSGCSFTSFIGYEYTATTDASNLHRNVIFRNANVPDYAVSYLEAPKPRLLWESLNETCNEGMKGCEVMAIPHNSNLSNGRMFNAIALENMDEAKAQAALRQRIEPLVELIQHKANSECANGLSGLLGEPDELCEFEQVRQIGFTPELHADATQDLQVLPINDCNGKTGAQGMVNQGCVSNTDFVRGALLLGIAEQQKFGVNPLKFGFIGSTDTHLSNAGDARETTWNGHIGYETQLESRLGVGFMATNRLGNPGGLAGVWAEENSRDAIFDAMKRREAFSTSGPRIRPRFFAGWDFPANACEQHDIVAIGYDKGVPMGADLTAAKGQSAPMFIAMAARDPARWAKPLQRLQIIKGWLAENGERHYKVFDVAKSKEAQGTGSLCAVFTDPEFDAKAMAYYYLRAVEVPSVRWDTAQCKAAGDSAPEACAKVGENMIQEMAWSSPIWFTP
ncbi:MAG: DUF3604 domain-containing protein [Pseudomonadota bacterium]